MDIEAIKRKCIIKGCMMEVNKRLVHICRTELFEAKTVTTELGNYRTRIKKIQLNCEEITKLLDLVEDTLRDQEVE